MITLPHLTAFRVSGDDAPDFLHNQLSADVKGLAMLESTWACYCEPKGRVLALLLVTRFDDGFKVIMSSTLAQAVADRMKIYVMRSRVDISVLSKTSVSGLQGDQSPGMATESIPTMQLPHSERRLALMEPASAPDIHQGLLDSWQSWELRHGICWLSDLTSGQFLPQMLGFDKLGAVNFKKGCYPGQEIVARTHYLGKVKRHPRILELSKISQVNPMDKIHLQSCSTTHEAVLVESAGNEEIGYCLFVVSRLDPDSTIEKIELATGN